MFDVITMGSATIDMFADTGNALFGKKTPFGSKIRLERLETHTGGGGTNTAVAFSRLGLKTAYMGKIGDDIYGHAIAKELHKENVDTRYVQHGGQTGQSIILDSKQGDRIILTHKGTNDEFAVKDLENMKTKWIYSSSLQHRAFISFMKVVAHAKMHGIKVAWNPSAYQIKESRDEVMSMLSLIDVLVFNAEEAELLLGCGKPKEHLMQLNRIGIPYVAITDGKKGAYLSDKGRMFHCEAQNAKVVETTGAGDAFASGLVGGLALKNDMMLGAQIGMNNSASVVSYYGAKNILLNYKESIKKKVKTSAI